LAYTEDIARPVRLVLRPSLLLLLAAVGLALVVTFAIFASARPVIVFAAATVGGLAALYTAYYNSASIRLQLTHNRQARAFDFMQRFNDVSFTRGRVLYDTLDLKGLARDELVEKIETDSDLRTTALTIINLYESLSIGIQRGFVDEEVAFLFFVTILPAEVDGLAPFIDYNRKKHGDPLIWDQTVKLGTAWRGRKSVIDSKRVMPPAT
jgi:hypothetical protein